MNLPPTLAYAFGACAAATADVAVVAVVLLDKSTAACRPLTCKCNWHL